MIWLTLSRRVHVLINAGRNNTSQYKMCAAKESRGYLSVRSSTRCILAANCSIDSPLVSTLDRRKSWNSKRGSVSDKSLRKTTEEYKRTWPRRSPRVNSRKYSYSRSRCCRRSIVGKKRRLVVCITCTSSCMLCLSDHWLCRWPPKIPLQWPPGLLKGTRWAKHDDVFQKAKHIPTPT